MSAVVNTLRGLGGSDLYYLGAGDIADETAVGSGGIDSVFANANHGLAANIENLYLFGTALGVNGNGNGLNNQMFGNLHTGANILRGLGGNDIYTIGANDTVDETIGGSSGTDTVQASFSYTLGTNVENLFLLGATGGMIGTGNAANNGLNGTLSTAANSFRGLAGNDTYVLGAGDGANESVAGSGGIDTIVSALTHALGANLENLTLTGGGVVNGTGNGLVNRIIGNAANNILVGGALGDTLTGGLGKDTFKYNSAAESLAATRDTITDFQDGAGPLDVIDLTGVRPGPTATSLLTYIGAGPVTAAFQVGVRASGADVRVFVNLDGNLATAEMEILLTGTTLASMAGGDFLL
jgi:Ca2+-binding RTX toxin-like protein